MAEKNCDLEVETTGLAVAVVAALSDIKTHKEPLFVEDSIAEAQVGDEATQNCV